MENKKLVKPKKLEKGDTIGIIAPSAGNANFFPHRIDTAIKCLEKLGFKVKFAKHSLENIGYVSSIAKLRAKDICDMFEDDSVSAILCTIGGNHSNQILKYIDFELVKRNPKIFMGYSDISVLHYAMISNANLQTFYGPCIMTQFGEFPEILPYTLEYFKKAVCELDVIGNILSSESWTSEILDWSFKKDLDRARILNKSTGYDWLRGGFASGKIIGGCIPSINHLAGTKFWVDPSNCIFFIDIPEGHEFGVGLSISELDSYLADLDNLGVFKKITGLIIGRPYNYSLEDYSKLKELILNYVEEYDYPVVLDVNIGHSDPIITLPLGAYVTLDSNKNKFSINESGVK
jgi:muramoyltetrapeptide carboxypeptidase